MLAIPWSIRARARGQALPLVAIALTFLVLAVGLAVDGGSFYVLHRTAQSAADGAALAGTRQMLQYYDDMLLNSQGEGDRNGSAEQEQVIADALSQYVVANHAVTDTIQAYFVGIDRQIVTMPTGLPGPGGPVCGEGQASVPCRVGQNGAVPWARGARGIKVSVSSRTDAYFMALAGWNTLEAGATTIASMGVTKGADPNAGVFPMGFVESPQWFSRMKLGARMALADGRDFLSNVQYGRSWTWVNFNGQADNEWNSYIMQGWAQCGYNPALHTQEEWAAWCPDYRDVPFTQGPTQHWLGKQAPLSGSYAAYGLQWAYWNTWNTEDAWWVGGQERAGRSCDQMADSVAGMNGRRLLIPLFAAAAPAERPNTRAYHLFALAQFEVQNSYVQCPTPLRLYSYWHIEGTMTPQYVTGTWSVSGELRDASLHTVLLDPEGR